MPAQTRISLEIPRKMKMMNASAILRTPSQYSATTGLSAVRVGSVVVQISAAPIVVLRSFTAPAMLVIVAATMQGPHVPMFQILQLPSPPPPDPDTAVAVPVATAEA